MSTISFADIVKDRDSSVRVTVDGMIYAVDLVMVMTGKNRNDAGQTLRNLTDEIFSSVKFTEKNTGGSGGSRTKLVSFKDALELVMVLPGKVAKETRTQFAGIIQRYMAGHVSVAMEVEANAQSTGPIQQTMIQCDEISPGASARMAVIENVQYLSIRDLIQHWTGQDNKAASKIWDRLAETKKKEVSPDCRNFQFPGQGQSQQPVISFKGALKLVMMVTGDKAALYRASMVKILTRYYAGEGSLIDEVQANAQSTGPIQQMARASLVADAVPEASEEIYLPYKRKLAELEVAKRETEVQATKIANRSAELANLSMERDSAREHLTKIKDSYRELCEDTVMDERARLILKDNFLNMAMLQGPGRLLGNGPNQDKPISLSLVVGELGMKIPTNELISIGAELKKRYVEKHGKEPSKHEQLCGGRITKVNSYMESDRPLLEEVLRWHVAGRV